MWIRAANILILLLVSSGCLAQGIMEGEVTFVTADNVYVRFESTDGIVIGDTLELVREGRGNPCLLVSSRSSSSCACMIIKGCKAEKKDRVVFDPERSSGAHGSGSDIVPALVVYVNRKNLRHARHRFGVRSRYHSSRDVIDEHLANAPRRYSERIKGRVSAASFSTMPSARENDHRLMYRFALDAEHIGNSRFSAETYLNYRQLFPAGEISHPQQTRYFNVYSLAVRFEPDTTMSLTLGRKINNNASSLGAIDGLQAEKYFGNFFAGTIAGFRPDIVTYGFDPDLFELGAYGGARVNTANVRSRSTLGILQQNNAGVVDRRYTYFQHSSTINGKLDLFSSFELDLYNKLNGEARLTNLYVSSGYRFGRKVDVFASYDSRKRIVYYETYRSDVEMLLDDDEARQGARIRLGVKPRKDISMGVSLSRRFQSSGQNASDNINGFITFSGGARSWGRWSLQANRNTSAYMRSEVISVRHSRTLIKKKLNASIYYRVANYTYAARGIGEGVPPRVGQIYYGVDVTYNLGPKLMFTALGEASHIGEERNYRVNLSIIKRFDGKK